ncbi:MAG: hypothetical protein ABIC68_06015, partial [Candidatus Omnitrophota bacterium]
SSNPNNKYTYVRIIEGPGISKINNAKNHSLAIKGNFDKDGNITRENKFKVEVDGRLRKNEVAIIDLLQGLLTK